MMRRKSYYMLGMLICSLAVGGCAKQKTSQTADLNTDIRIETTEYTESATDKVQMQETAADNQEQTQKTEAETVSEQTQETSAQAETEQTQESEEQTAAATPQEPEILHFVDVFGEGYEVEIKHDVEKHGYDMAAFSRDGQKLSYESDTYTSQLGIDVSHHQGEINWNRVRDAGYEFAFIRLGYRGYKTGELCVDRYFVQNMQKAQACGMDVGIYFFSQAISKEEALEEADFVLQHLKGYELQLPVVYDPESILDAQARTDDISGEQFTKNTIAFCQAIEAAGYEAMIYSNMLWEAYELDLAQLSKYPIWYADYELLPQTPYHFTFWQYSNTGTVDGIGTDTDLNIRLIPKKKE